MIGIICFDHEKFVVQEFFELFKTPWEFHKKDKKYDVIISTGLEVEQVTPDLKLIYSSKATGLDADKNLQGDISKTGGFEYKEHALPIYGEMLTFHQHGDIHPDTKILLDCVYSTEDNNRPVLRIGYDLFQEVNLLLTDGQPANQARKPTLELHISLLCELIVSHGIPLVEIPAVPSGYSSITCLTHDVDFVRITDHKCDSTMLGFLYRALFGSVRGLLNGRGNWTKLLRNWAAAFSLPGVYLGIFKDFFNNIERYLKLEKGLASTFFLIPFKNQPGRASNTSGTVKRSVKYDVDDISQEIQALLEAGCEIGLHGINAWTDIEDGEIERQRIQDYSKTDQTGIRMHWLYFNQDTPAILEKSGFLYDSTLGYNEAVGFKCGTAKVFRFLNADKLSELPLIIQDTALFYPDRMNLKEPEADKLVKKIIQTIEQFGGVITLNWHQRSLGPERQWGIFYERILDYLKQRETWFASSGDAVRWFTKRKLAVFEKAEVHGKMFKVELNSPDSDNLPGIKLRIHRPSGNIDSNTLFESFKLDSFDVELENKKSFEIQL
jgi:hypothetical protein